jgi:Domain of unknown function (DUF4936)
VTAGRRELFVYYRVAEGEWREACAAVHELQRDLRACYPELTARVLRRPDVGDGLVTLMEVYSIDARSNPDGVDGHWQSRIEDAAQVLRRWLRSDRHVDCFDTVDA